MLWLWPLASKKHQLMDLNWKGIAAKEKDSFEGTKSRSNNGDQRAEKIKSRSQIIKANS